MSKQYKTYPNLNLSQTAKDVQKKWDEAYTDPTGLERHAIGHLHRS